jgi:hypothetical protein
MYSLRSVACLGFLSRLGFTPPRSLHVDDLNTWDDRVMLSLRRLMRLECEVHSRLGARGKGKCIIPNVS